MLRRIYRVVAQDDFKLNIQFEDRDGVILNLSHLFEDVVEFKEVQYTAYSVYWPSGMRWSLSSIEIAVRKVRPEETAFYVWEDFYDAISRVPFLDKLIPGFFDQLVAALTKNTRLYYAAESARQAYEKLNLIYPLYEAQELFRISNESAPKWLTDSLDQVHSNYTDGSRSPYSDKLQFEKYIRQYKRWNAVWAERQVKGGIAERLKKNGMHFSAEFDRAHSRDKAIDIVIDPSEAIRQNTFDISKKTAQKEFDAFQSFSIDGWVYIPNSSLVDFRDFKDGKRVGVLTPIFGRWLPDPLSIWAFLDVSGIFESELKNKLPNTYEGICMHIKQTKEYRKLKSSRLYKNNLKALDLGASMFLYGMLMPDVQKGVLSMGPNTIPLFFKK